MLSLHYASVEFGVWLGPALLANSACYWLRRLHPIQTQTIAPKFRALVKHPG